MQSLFTIFADGANGATIDRGTVDISRPKADGSARKVGKSQNDRLKAALRTYGCRTIRTDSDGNVYAVGSRSGKRLWAVPMENNNSRKRSKRNTNTAPVNNSAPSNLPVNESQTVINAMLDGSMQWNEETFNAAVTVMNATNATTPTIDSDAPYGRRKDGTPARKRGRKPASAVVTESHTNSSEKPLTRKRAKREIAGMLDGSLEFDADRMAQLATIVAR